GAVADHGGLELRVGGGVAEALPAAPAEADGPDLILPDRGEGVEVPEGGVEVGGDRGRIEQRGELRAAVGAGRGDHEAGGEQVGDDDNVAGTEQPVSEGGLPLGESEDLVDHDD